MKVVPCFTAAVWSAAICLALGAGLLPASPVRADVFTYTDADGVTHFSNVPTDSRYQPMPGASAAAAGVPLLPPIASPNRGPDRFAFLIAHAAADTGLPEGLLHAVIKTESNYNPDAVSRKGAVGLMQLMPETARRYGVEDPRDPLANVLGGARYLRNLLALFGDDIPLALAAYNAGPAAVTRHGRALPPYAETRRYVPRVLDIYRRDAGQ